MSSSALFQVSDRGVGENFAQHNRTEDRCLYYVGVEVGFTHQGVQTKDDIIGEIYLTLGMIDRSSRKKTSYKT